MCKYDKMRVPLEMVFYLFIVKEEHMRILFWFFMSFMCIGRSTQILVLRFYCFWFHSICSYFRFFICVKVDLEKKEYIFRNDAKNSIFKRQFAIIISCCCDGRLTWTDLDKFQIRFSSIYIVFIALFLRLFNTSSQGK